MTDGVDLAAVCPETITIQTDWFPEAEHGALYQMIGAGSRRSTPRPRSSAARSLAGGEDTGVNLEIRTGGPAVGLRAGRHADGPGRQHHVRLRRHRRSHRELRRQPDHGVRRTARDQPADHHVGSRDLPGRRDDRRPRHRQGRRRCHDPLLRDRRLHAVPAQLDGQVDRGPARRQLRRRPVGVHRREAATSPSRASPRPSRTTTRTSSPTGASRSSSS